GFEKNERLVQIPDGVCVFLDCTVSTEITGLSNVDKRHLLPTGLVVLIGAQSKAANLVIGFKVTQNHVWVAVLKRVADWLESIAGNVGANLIDCLFENRIAKINFVWIISAGLELVYFRSAHTEYKDVVRTNRFTDFD